MTLGLSRDDSGKFLESLPARRHLLRATRSRPLTSSGVGELVELAVERGRAARPDLKLGICGEHGGDPASVAFCERAGLDYVSCSPIPRAHRPAGGGTGRDPAAKQAH